MESFRLVLVSLFILFQFSNADIIKNEQNELQLKDKLLQTFYLSFDNQLKPDYSAGAGNLNVHGQVPLIGGKKGTAGFFEEGSFIEITAWENFNPNEGTLSMWVKPFSGADDGNAHCLFEVPQGDKLDGSFLVSKGFTDKVAPTFFYIVNSPPWHGTYVDASSFWKSDQWVHILVSWSQKKNKFSLYANGLMQAEITSQWQRRPISSENLMYIAARSKGMYNFEGLIDELIIYNRDVTAQEAWELSGGQGKTPRKSIKILDPAEITSLPHELITDHEPIAKPLFCGPIKTLFLIPQNNARDVVELWQRMSIDYDAFLLYTRNNEPYGWGGGASYAQRHFYGISEKERLEDLNHKLDLRPQVLVFANAPLRKAPEDIQNRILKMVEDGMGLVMIGIGIDDRFTSPESQLDTEIISNGPWSALPELFYGENIDIKQLPQKVVKTFKYGKGKVVTIHYHGNPRQEVGNLFETEGLTPNLYDIAYTKNWDQRYVQYLSLIGKSILWASDNQSGCKLQLPPDGIKIKQSSMPEKFKFNIEAQNSDIEQLNYQLSVKDLEGESVLSIWDNVALNENSSEVAFNLPKLTAGKYYLNVNVFYKGKICDWGSTSIDIEADNEIVEVLLDKESVEKGEKVQGQIIFSQNIDKEATLIVRAEDTNKRIYAEKVISLNSGLETVEFDLELADPSTVASYITADLFVDDFLVSSSFVTVFVPKRNIANLYNDSFLSIGWAGLWPITGSGKIYAQQIRNAGINAVLLWPVNHAVRNAAMWDFSPVAYTTRLVMRADSKGHTTGGSWADPEVKQKQLQKLNNYLIDTKKYGPIFYSLGDENHYRGEMGFSEYGLKAYQNYLKNQYKTISRLNLEWGTSYNDFDEVPRLGLDQAKENKNVPAMIAHRATNEMVWRQMYAYLREKIIKYDPKAKVGAEGSETNDLEKMLETVDVWAPYPYDERVLALMQSVNDADHQDWILGAWHGAYAEFDMIPNAGLTRLYSQLFKGYSNSSFYYACDISNGEGMLMPDGSYTEFFRTQLFDLKLLNNGLGQQLRVCKPKLCGVYIHWSQASRFGLEASDEFGFPHEADGKLIETLNKLNIINWRYVTTKQLENGFIPDAAKVIILPVSQCLSTKEAETLETFVSRGGLIVAIGPVGIRSEFGRILESGQFDEVLGVNINGLAKPVKVSRFQQQIEYFGQSVNLVSRSNSLLNTIKPATAEVLASVNGIPIFLSNNFENGKTILLNFDIADFGSESIQKLITAILNNCGIKSFVKFYPTGGPEGNYGFIQTGDLNLLGVIMDHRRDKWNGGKISLPSKLHVYDAKKGEYLGKTDEILVAGLKNRQSSALFALQKKKINHLKLDFEKNVKRNKKLDIYVSVACDEDFSCESRVVKIDFADPSGAIKNHYQKMAYLNNNGKATINVEFALNDSLGKWKITAVDVTTGITNNNYFNLE